MKPFIIIQKNSVFVNRDGREGNRDGSRFQQPLDKLGCEVGSSTFVIPAKAGMTGKRTLSTARQRFKGKTGKGGRLSTQLLSRVPFDGQY
jgi:hypothetical protein